MKRQTPRPGIGRPQRAAEAAPARASDAGGLLGLQQSAGNAAVVQLLSSKTVQRGEPDADPGGELIPLADAIEAKFTMGPFHVPSVVELIQSARLDERDTAFASPSVRSTVQDALDEDGRAEVFSALLAGRTYSPDWESTIFQTYETKKADEVSAEVNRRFVAAVGVSRALDWSSAIDKPLARYWLRLRDDVVREDIGREEEQRFRDEVLAALATSPDEAISVIGAGLPEQLEAALRSQAFMQSLRDDSADFEAFARLAEALGRQPPIEFGLRDRDAVRKAFSAAWSDFGAGTRRARRGRLDLPQPDQWRDHR